MRQPPAHTALAGYHISSYTVSGVSSFIVRLRTMQAGSRALIGQICGNPSAFRQKQRGIRSSRSVESIAYHQAFCMVLR
ncbi:MULTISPECIES: hypothetical protein [unclassified Bacteroides]|uniref:hypothetical protein n=1 Tax=unclassified Bacteroides TaxID=2646097 RepID=UPI0011C194BC|nr:MULTISPECIES: hypothetical protein [unclassified Bacteroides]